MSKIFCGIADAHGLESFQQCSEIGAAPNTLGMRAAYKQAQEDGNWHIPLLLLKDEDFCGEIAMEDEMKESWKLIPNDSLDPYWSMD